MFRLGGDFLGSQRGAGSVLSIVSVFLLLILLVSAAIFVRVINLRATLQAHADQAALAAADASRGLVQGSPCQLAFEIAENAEFELTLCKVEGYFARIVLETRVIGLSITGVSVAGPP